MPPCPSHSLNSLPEFHALPDDLKQRDDIVRLGLALVASRGTVERLKEALQFYADKKHFTWEEAGDAMETYVSDEGEVAQKALDSLS
jgi:hypothetical protein